MNDDHRYKTRIRHIGGYNPDDAIPNWPEGPELGIWDTVEKCWVKRDSKTGEWVREDAA